MSISLYYINLDSAPERKEWFETQARHLELCFERVSAVDSKDRSVKEAYERSRPSQYLTIGEYACRKSHAKAWEAFLKTGQPYAVIFEDDARIANDFKSLLGNDVLLRHAGLIRLESYVQKVVCSQRYQRIPPGNRTLSALLSGAFGGAAYLLSREVAGLLVRLETLYHGQLDGLLWSENSMVRLSVKPLQLIPAACIQEDQLARLEHREGVFRSSLKIGCRPKDPRDKIAKTTLQKILRFLRHIALGANPFKYRRIIPVSL